MFDELIAKHSQNRLFSKAEAACLSASNFKEVKRLSCDKTNRDPTV